MDQLKKDMHYLSLSKSMHLFRFSFYCFLFCLLFFVCCCVCCFLRKKSLKNDKSLITLNDAFYQQVVFVDGNGLFHYRGKFHIFFLFYFAAWVQPKYSMQNRYGRDFSSLYFWLLHWQFQKIGNLLASRWQSRPHSASNSCCLMFSVGTEFGLACHLGVLSELPCVGVAKNLLQVQGVSKSEEHQSQVHPRVSYPCNEARHTNANHLEMSTKVVVLEVCPPADRPAAGCNDFYMK